MSTQTLINGLFTSELEHQSDRPLAMEARLNELDGERNADMEMFLRTFGGGGAGREARTRMKSEWRNFKRVPMYCKVTVVDAVGQAHIEVDNYQYIHRDCLLKNTRTSELMLMHSHTAVSADATVDILSYTSLAAGGTGTLAYATAVGDIIQILPEAHAEGDDFPEAWAGQSTDDYTYIMEIARRSAQISNIAMNEEEYNPVKKRALDNKYAMIEVMEGISRLMWNSIAVRETTSAASGTRRHSMAGLLSRIQTNVKAMGAGQAVTTDLLGEILRLATKHTSSSKSKLFVAGQYMVRQMNAWPKSWTIAYNPDQAGNLKVGYNVVTAITPYGELNAVKDASLTEEFGMADIAAIIDTAYVKSIYLQGLGMRIIEKIANLSTSFQIVDGITTTYGLEVKNEENSAILTGIN